MSPKGNLLIKDVQSEDAGNYTCVAKNDYGTDSIDYEVIVEGKNSLFIMVFIYSRGRSMFTSSAIEKCALTFDDFKLLMLYFCGLDNVFSSALISCPTVIFKFFIYFSSIFDSLLLTNPVEVFNECMIYFLL